MKTIRIILSQFIIIFFATPIPQAEGAPSRPAQAKPWLGVRIETLQPPEIGVVIKAVLEDTPAKEAGLQADDRVQKIDETTVSSAEQFTQIVQSKGVGHAVKVYFTRQGKPEVKTIKLVARPDMLAMIQQQLVGKPAPLFDLPLIAGQGPNSSDKLKGRVAIIEFWATWCPACRSTHPALNALAERQQREGKKDKQSIAIIAISDDSREDIEAYAKLLNPKFAMVQDKEQAVSQSWMVSAIPQLVVLDRQGKAIFATVGAGEYLEQAISVAEKELKK